MTKTSKQRAIAVATSIILVLLFAAAEIIAFNNAPIIAVLPSLSQIIIIGVSLIITYTAHTFFHPFGHYIAGKVFNFSLLTFQAGPFKFLRDNNKLKFQCSIKNWSSGICLMLPDTQDFSFIKYFLFYLGGPLLQFFFLILAYLPTMLLAGGSSSVTLTLVLFFDTILGCILILFNALPYIRRGIPTDGKILLGLILDDDTTNQLIEADLLNRQLAFSLRPRYLVFDSQFSNCPTINQYTQSIALFKLWHALDCSDMELAKNVVKEIEASCHLIHPINSQVLYSELVYYFSAIELDPIKAIYYYNMVSRELLNNNNINGRRVLAAYEFYINQDKAAAISCIATAISVADSFPFKGQLLLEKDLVFKLQESIMLG